MVANRTCSQCGAEWHWGACNTLATYASGGSAAAPVSEAAPTPEPKWCGKHLAEDGPCADCLYPEPVPTTPLAPAGEPTAETPTLPCPYCGVRASYQGAVRRCGAHLYAGNPTDYDGYGRRQEVVRNELAELRARVASLTTERDAGNRRINALWCVMEERGSAEFTVWASEQVGCDDLLLDVGPCESLTALLDAIADFYDSIPDVGDEPEFPSPGSPV